MKQYLYNAGAFLNYTGGKKGFCILQTWTQGVYNIYIILL